MARYSRIFMFSLKYTIFCIVIVGLLLLIGSICKSRRSGTFTFFTLLAVISAIRVNTGSDYFNYYINYETVTNYYNRLIDTITSRYQFGIISMDYAVQKLFGNSNGIFIAISVVVSVILWGIFRCYSQFPRISASVWLLSGFYLISNNLLKQYIAMLFMMIGYFFMRRRHFVLFIFCTFLASVFHLTALLVAPMYFFSTHIPVTKRSLVLCCTFGGALLVIVYPIIRILVKVRLFSKYEQYLDSAATVGYRFIIASVIMGVFYFVIVLVYLRSIESLSEDARQYIRMIMIGLILTIVSVRFFYLSRVAYYFLQFLPLLVANAFNKQMNDTTIARTMRSRILIWLTIYCFLFTAFSGENNYYNYSTIINDVPVSVQEFISR